MRLVLLLCLLPSLVFAAENDDARRTNLVLEPVQAALDGSPFISLWQAQSPQAWRWHYALSLSHSSEPLRELKDGETLRAIVAYRRQASASLAVGLPRQLQLGLSFPYLLDQQAEYPGYRVGSLAQSGLVDPKVWLKWSRPLLAKPWSTALVVAIDLPLGDDQAYSGRGALAGAFDALLGWQQNGLQASAQVGYYVEPSRSLFNAFFDDYLRLAAGLRYAPKDVDWALLAEADLRIGGAPAVALTSRVGVEFRFAGIRLPVAFVQPMTSRPGQPRFAALAALQGSYRRPPDFDGDGLRGEADQCPKQPEDFDGHLDTDGCPDFDKDRDGIHDDDDACQEQPEDFDGFEDADGCPDLDNDKDGVLDSKDQCPMVPENINDIADDDGCPEPDSDFDGILDPDDQCPRQPEDLDKWQDSDGCPEPDNDGDGLLDGDDDCPNEAETFNGVDDEDGCPEKAVLEIRRMKPHRIKARIHFRKHHWAIAPRSGDIIEMIAKLIKEHPEIVKLRIEGHTDHSGRRLANRRLSQKRADEVMKALLALGIAPELLEAKGYGWSMPIDKRRGRRARRRNRRVGFLVLEVAAEVNDEAKP